MGHPGGVSPRLLPHTHRPYSKPSRSSPGEAEPGHPGPAGMEQCRRAGAGGGDWGLPRAAGSRRRTRGALGLRTAWPAGDPGRRGGAAFWAR